jgi:hypothetical protein
MISPWLTSVSDRPLEEALERGDVHVLAPPIPLPAPADQEFLRTQELRLAKEIVFEASSGRLSGFRPRSPEQTSRLRTIFETSQRQASVWLQGLLPRYTGHLIPARTCFHVAEEATRRLRVTSRYDLLHFDTLHHSRGRRILRLFVNLNPIDPRVFASSRTLAEVLPEFGPKSGLFDAGREHWSTRVGREVVKLFRPDFANCDPFDQFMIEFSRYLKHSEEFQDKSIRKVHRFAPGQAWIAFTDSLIHADLRGRWVLDHMFLIPTDVCALPELAPIAIYENLRGRLARRVG